MMNKRIFATLVAMGMVASMGTMAVSAATDATGATGTGGVEAIIDKEVVDVTLPTSDAVDTELNFTMDPQTLASSATGAAIDAAKFTSTDKTLFFKNSNGDYTDTSDPVTLKVFNSENADLNVKAEVKTASKLTFSSSDDWGATDKDATGEGAEEKKAQAALDEKAHIWLQISSTLTPGGDSAGSAETPVTATFTSTGAELKDSIDKLGTGCFVTKYVAESGSGETLVPAHYEYAAADSKVANQVDIKLTGKTNPNADWDGLASETLNIEYTWSIKKHVDSYLAQNTVSSSDATIEFANGKLPEGVSIAKCTLNKTNGTNVLMASSYYTVAEGSVTIKSSLLTSEYKGATITIDFSDNTSETVTIE